LKLPLRGSFSASFKRAVFQTVLFRLYDWSGGYGHT
jgi:hypothetical protein